MNPIEKTAQAMAVGSSALLGLLIFMAWMLWRALNWSTEQMLVVQAVIKALTGVVLVIWSIRERKWQQQENRQQTQVPAMQYDGTLRLEHAIPPTGSGIGAPAGPRQPVSPNPLSSEWKCESPFGTPASESWVLFLLCLRGESAIRALFCREIEGGTPEQFLSPYFVSCGLPSNQCGA
jgi:hypothetical protein